MINYATDRFLLLQYPNGAGGKFLLSCLFLFDEIAHWEIDVEQGKKTHLDWCYRTWPKKISQWLIAEPNQPWQLDFYSRRWFRGNNLSKDSFNLAVAQHASSYFHDCWQQGKIITDHWHKRSLPEFFLDARRIEILLASDDLEIYKFCTKNKLFFWNQSKQAVYCAPDAPEYAYNSRTLKHVQHFKNPVWIGGYRDYDSFFYEYLLQQHFVKPFVQAVPDPDCISSLTFMDLIQRDRFVTVIGKLEEYFGQKIDLDMVLQTHALWLQRSHINV